MHTACGRRRRRSAAATAHAVGGAGGDALVLAQLLPLPARSAALEGMRWYSRERRRPRSSAYPASERTQTCRASGRERVTGQAGVGEPLVCV